jgi:hypothetical protein
LTWEKARIDMEKTGPPVGRPALLLLTTDY